MPPSVKNNYFGKKRIDFYFLASLLFKIMPKISNYKKISNLHFTFSRVYLMELILPLVTPQSLIQNWKWENGLRRATTQKWITKTLVWIKQNWTPLIVWYKVRLFLNYKGMSKFSKPLLSNFFLRFSILKRSSLFPHRSLWIVWLQPWRR